MQPNPLSGKSLLLRGEAGSGKTHLMRAFRNEVHRDGTGYCGYLQMTTRTGNYARYILSNFIDALSQPYRLPNPGGSVAGAEIFRAAADSTPPSAGRGDLIRSIME
jgi:hypothetical protein